MLHGHSFSLPQGSNQGLIFMFIKNLYLIYQYCLSFAVFEIKGVKIIYINLMFPKITIQNIIVQFWK